MSKLKILDRPKNKISPGECVNEKTDQKISLHPLSQFNNDFSRLMYPEVQTLLVGVILYVIAHSGEKIENSFLAFLCGCV